MPLVYRTSGSWGPGKGANLSAAEVDENFWWLYQLVLSVQAAQPPPDEITNVTKTGNTITFHMASGGTWGPFTLPFAIAETTPAEITTSTHTLGLGDFGRFYDVKTSCVVTLPDFATVPITTGAEIHFRLDASGASLYFVAASGVNLKGMQGHDAGLTLRGGVVTVKCIGTNEFVLFGYLDLGGTGTYGTGTGTA